MMMRAGISKYKQALQSANTKDNAGERDRLISEYAPMVKYIAERMAVRLPPSVSTDELISAGIVGLFDAVDKFDAKMGNKFQTYARHRIKGAMLDELRKMDWVPRSVRKDAQTIENAVLNLQTRLRREPEDEEIAQEIGLDLSAYYKMLGKTQGIGLVNYDDAIWDIEQRDEKNRSSWLLSPFEELKIKEMKKAVAESLVRLKEKERQVMSLYYYEEMTLKEIAEIMGLTESRICQIHSQTIMKLRARLKHYFNA